jgi:hypothetical protein
MGSIKRFPLLAEEVEGKPPSKYSALIYTNRRNTQTHYILDASSLFSIREQSLYETEKALSSTYCGHG